METKITPEELLSSGYQEFFNETLGHKHAKRFFQKRIKDKKGTHYFINVFMYDLSEVFKKEKYIKYQVETQFTKYGKAYDVSFEGITILQVEEDMKKFYLEMSFDMYEAS